MNYALSNAQTWTNDNVSAKKFRRKKSHNYANQAIIIYTYMYMCIYSGGSFLHFVT